MTEVADAAVHLQKDFLHDVFEIRGAPEHALGEARDVLTVGLKKLSKRLRIATLAALDEAGGIHRLDFTSDGRGWLALVSN